MKKIIAIFTAMFLLAGASANAQISNILNSLKSNSSSSSSSSSSESSSSSILSTISDVVSTLTGSSSAISLEGTWSYTGSAIELESDSTLSSLAGTVVSSSAESSVNEYLEKLGLTEGSMTYTFESDSTFTSTFKKISMSGTYSQNTDAGTVTLKYGKKLSYLSMTGDLSSTSGGCQMLFEGDKFLSFMKAALSLAGSSSSTASTLSSLSDNYNGMKIGVQLEKTSD